MLTNTDTIKFHYTEEDFKAFSENQKRDIKMVENFYSKLKIRCLEKIEIIPSGTHKEWIRARADMHLTTSIMRLLYLTESFCNSSENFNSVASAAHIKAMTEIPMHLGYLVWILSENHTFEDVKNELSKIAWGNKSSVTGLTSTAKITQKEFYEKADLVSKKIFKEHPDTMNVFEILYKEANAIGHHNYEGRNLLCGVQNGNTWKAKDRKEWFVFISKNIFQFFLYATTILSMSDVFCNAISHYLEKMPDYLVDKK